MRMELFLTDMSIINPRVRNAGKTVFDPGYDGAAHSGPLLDHDLHLAFKGCGSVVVDDVDYPMAVGDVLIVYPGESFCVRVNGDRPFARYHIHFDFFHDPGKRLLTPSVSRGCRWPRLVRLHQDVQARSLCADIVLRMTGLTGEALQLTADGQLKALLGILLEQHEERSPEAKEGVSPSSRKGIMKAVIFIRENYAAAIARDDMAREAGFSVAYFGRAFKSVTGKTPFDYLTDYRLEQARRLMVETDISIGEVAQRCGYEDIHYFSYLFKHRTGITPTEFIASFSIEEQGVIFNQKALLPKDKE